MIRDGCINLGPTEGLEEAWGGRGVSRTRVQVLDHGVWAVLRTSNQSQLRRRRELGEGDEHDFYVSKGAILSLMLSAALSGLKFETAGSKDSERGRNNTLWYRDVLGPTEDLEEAPGVDKASKPESESLIMGSGRH